MCDVTTDACNVGGVTLLPLPSVYDLGFCLRLCSLRTVDKSISFRAHLVKMASPNGKMDIDRVMSPDRRSKS